MARVLLVTHIFPPAIDGGSRVIAKAGDQLHKMGHNVMTLTSNAQSTDDFTHRYIGITSSARPAYPVFRLPVYTILHRPLKLVSRSLSKGPLFKLVPLIKFINYCRDFRPEYIIAGPLPTAICLYAYFLKKLTGAKLLINASYHENDPDFHDPLLIYTLKRADFIWTLTRHETQYFNKYLKIPKKRLILLGNGIDSSLLTKKSSHDSKSKNLLYIGAFAAHKGLETLIDAFSLLAIKNKSIHLTLAGQPTLYSPILEKKIKSLPTHIRSRLKTIKKFNDIDLPKLLDSTTILISPSTQESFGLVLLEAMARGVPVVAADIPASTELISDSRSGLLFKSGNAKDLSTKILKLLDSPKISEYCENGKKYAADHTWDRIILRLWQKLSSSSH